MSMLRRLDLEVPMQQLTRFYRVLHRGLTHADQVIMFEDVPCTHKVITHYAMVLLDNVL